MMLTDDKHIFISGQTGSGKTYFSEYLMNIYKGSVLFFNSQRHLSKSSQTKTNFISITGQTDTKIIKKAIDKNFKINYLPSENRETAKKELDYIIDFLFHLKLSKRLLIVIDEIADYAPQSLGLKENSPSFLARRGRSYNLKMVGITQTPADVSKSITKQCGYHIIFLLNFYEEAYFSNFKINSKEMAERIKNNGKYSFAYFGADIDYTIHKAIEF